MSIKRSGVLRPMCASTCLNNRFSRANVPGAFVAVSTRKYYSAAFGPVVIGSGPTLQLAVQRLCLGSRAESEFYTPSLHLNRRCLWIAGAAVRAHRAN